jgi:hypothetical protein
MVVHCSWFLFLPLILNYNLVGNDQSVGKNELMEKGMVLLPEFVL